MKNKKAKLLIIGGIVVALLVAVSAFALNKFGGNDVPNDSEVSADDNPFMEDTGYAKSEVALDGVLDDKQWDGLKEISYSEKTTTTVKGFYGENGIYIGAVVQDTDLWATSSKVYDNTSFELYLDKTGKGGTEPNSNHLQLFVDINEQSLARDGEGGVWIDTDLIKSYAVKVDGTVGDDVEDKGYTIEMFIPYSQLGGETEINYGIAFGTVGCKDGERESWCGIPGVNVQSPDTYYIFYRDTNEISKARKVNLAKYNVDGKDEDVIWKDRTKYVFGEKERGSVSNYFAEEGLYFFFEMQDDKVCAEGTAVYLNDSVEMYIDTLGNGGKKPQKDDVQVRVDVSGNIEVLKGNGTEWEPKNDNTFAEIQKTETGYNVEVFIPWADLGMEKTPESMNVSFGSVDWDGVKKSDGSRERTWSGIGSDPQVPDNYIKMTKTSVEASAKAGILVVTPPDAPESEVKLDGVFDDKLWEKAQLFLYSGMSAKVRYVWTENGCYMGFDVTDDNVKTESKKVFENSSVEIYLDAQDNDGNPDDNDRTILVDAAGNMSFRKGVDGKYIDFIGSAIQSKTMKTPTGYTVELYIPWVELGESKPAKMGVAFGQVMRFEGEEKTRWFNDGFCKDPQKPALYALFTEKQIGNE